MNRGDAMKKWRMIRRFGGALTLFLALAGVGGIGVSTAPPASAAFADLVPGPITGASDSLLSPRVSEVMAASKPTDLIPAIVTTTWPAGSGDENRARAKGSAVKRRYASL